MIWEDDSVSRKPLDHDTAAGDNAGFHHMHRLDLLMCLYKRVFEFAPETGAECPIRVHMAKRLAAVSQDDDSVTVTFSDGTTETGDLLIGADGVNSQVLEAVWPGVSQQALDRGDVSTAVWFRATRSPRRASPTAARSTTTPSTPTRWTAAIIPTAQALTYWVRGGELLNVWLAYYEPNAEEFEGDEGDWFPVDQEEMLGNMEQGVRRGPPSRRRPRTREPDREPDEVGALRPRRARELDGGSRGSRGRRRSPDAADLRPGCRAVLRGRRGTGQVLRAPRHGHLPRAAALRARPLLPRDALPVRVEVPLQAPRAGGHTPAPADPRGAQRARLPRLRSHGARGQATTRGSTRSTRATSATSCRSRSSGRGTSARGRRRSPPARRSPAASGSRRSH